MALSETQLRLGNFSFREFEVPESITFGLGQKTVVKKFVGGMRDVQALGVDPVDPSWSGIFLGPDALNRANQLKAMTAAGRQLELTWSTMRYVVLISLFEPDFRRPYHIPYKISLTVVRDLSSLLPVYVPNATNVINADVSKAEAIVSQVDHPPLSTSMSALSKAARSISDFAKASQAALNSVLAPLAAVQSQVKMLIATTENTLMNVTTVGGLLPNNPASRLVAKLSNYVNANTQQPQLLQLQSVLGRIGVNIGQVNSSVRTVTVSGGNLMDVAAKQYGDPMGYTAILAANPSLKGEVQLSGITTLVIPPYTNKSDGIVQ